MLAQHFAKLATWPERLARYESHAHSRGVPVRFAALDPTVQRAIATWLRAQMTQHNLPTQLAHRLPTLGTAGHNLSAMMRDMQLGDTEAFPMYHDAAVDAGIHYPEHMHYLNQAYLRRLDEPGVSPLHRAYAPGGSPGQEGDEAAMHLLLHHMTGGNAVHMGQMLPALRQQAQTGRPAYHVGGGVGSRLWGLLGLGDEDEIMPQHMRRFLQHLQERDPINAMAARTNTYRGLLGQLGPLLNLHELAARHTGQPSAHEVAHDTRQAIGENMRVRENVANSDMR